MNANLKIGCCIGFVIGFFAGGIAMFVSLPQPFEAYLNGELINFESFNDFELACESVIGTIQCGPVCTCSFKSRQEMISYADKAVELVNECADKAMIVIDERDACLKKLNE